MSVPTATTGVRERILGVAKQRFYAEGIRAVSADRLIADAAVSKVTFYRHFRSKDELVTAYLADIAAEERQLVTAQRLLHPVDPLAVLCWYADSLGMASCAPGFRGCPFINAAAEYPDAQHPARQVVQQHRSWLYQQARELAQQLQVHDPAATAEELLMLRDGAMISGYLGGAAELVTSRLKNAGRAVLIDAGAQL
jgi:AcrR family transcriptional regulator